MSHTEQVKQPLSIHHCATLGHAPRDTPAAFKRLQLSGIDSPVIEDTDHLSPLSGSNYQYGAPTCAFEQPDTLPVFGMSNDMPSSPGPDVRHAGAASGYFFNDSLAQVSERDDHVPRFSEDHLPDEEEPAQMSSSEYFSDQSSYENGVYLDPQIFVPQPSAGDPLYPASTDGARVVKHEVDTSSPYGLHTPSSNYPSTMTPPPPYAHSQVLSLQQPVIHQPLAHRASISGPVMPHPHYAAFPGAPPYAGEFAAWGYASGGARPHTADGGMFASFGFPGMTGDGSSSSSSDSSVIGGSYIMQRRGTMESSSDTSAGRDSTFGHVHQGRPRAATAGNLLGYRGHGYDDRDIWSPEGITPFNSGSISASSTPSSGHKKRPRRRYDEIERLYGCSWQGCTKSYGTLNHLNAHVGMQKHGAKRAPSEFKDMRKAWRKQKREEEQRRRSLVDVSVGESKSRSSIASANKGRARAQSFQQQALPSSQASPEYVFPSPAMSSTRSALQAADTPTARWPPIPSSSTPMYPPSTGYVSQPVNNAPVQNNRVQRSPGQNLHSGGLGAYLMAHRGSI